MVNRILNLGKSNDQTYLIIAEGQTLDDTCFFLLNDTLFNDGLRKTRGYVNGKGGKMQIVMEV